MHTPGDATAAVSPFHHGEEAVQLRVGVRDSIKPWARKVVRTFMPGQHRVFYEQLPFIVAAARDAAGRQWVTLLADQPGFIRSPDDRSLEINALPRAGDALAGALTAGDDIGLLGIELDTRRRNRVNGSITATGNGRLRFTVGQAFGNCPQYITAREWEHVEIDPGQEAVVHHSRLDTAMQTWIESADTFFIGSGFRGKGSNRESFGMDASHRGGPAGFVRVINQTRLVFPDYAGNNHFNTIGNLTLDSRAGLLFVDFAAGSLLQISGRATIDFDSPEVARHEGAQRLVIIDIDEIVRQDKVLPLRWRQPGEAARPLQVVRKTRESENVTSFVLTPREGGALPKFRAGQHLPIEVQLPGQVQPLQRTYSLSGGPGGDEYRITVKREPGGRVSGHLHDHVNAGDVIRAGEPAGEFILEHGDRPLVLISAGVGITPMVSMLYAELENPQQRPVTFIHGAQDGAHHALASEVQQLAGERKNIRVVVAYSRPSDTDRRHQAFQYEGRIDAAVICETINDFDADFYLCGPTAFMADVIEVLTRHRVSGQRIRSETFGPAAAVFPDAGKPVGDRKPL